MVILLVVFVGVSFWLFAFTYHCLTRSNFELYAAELAAKGESIEVDALRDQFRFHMETFRHGLAESGFAAFTGIRINALRSRVFRDHARIAVALALHRTRNGQFPANLDSLIFPDNAPLPLDPFTGATYRYRPLGLADYLLYSPGPNSRDDGGLLRYDHKKGDWVWRLHLPDDFDFDEYRQR